MNNLTKYKTLKIKISILFIILFFLFFKNAQCQMADAWKDYNYVFTLETAQVIDDWADTSKEYYTLKINSETEQVSIPNNVFLGEWDDMIDELYSLNSSFVRLKNINEQIKIDLGFSNEGCIIQDPSKTYTDWHRKYSDFWELPNDNQGEEEYYGELVPLLEIESVDSKIICYDKILKLNIKPRGKDCYNQNIPFLLQIATVKDKNWVDITKFTKFKCDGTYELTFDDLGDSKYLGQELMFRIVQDFSGYLNNNVADADKTYTSDLFTGIFFLEEPSLSIKAHDATCPDDTPYFTIDNIPYNNSDVDLQISISRLSKDKSMGDDQTQDTTVNNIPYYWDIESTLIYPIPKGSTSPITINNSAIAGSSLTLGNGYYTFKVRYMDGSLNSLCSQKISTELKVPAKLSATITASQYTSTNGTTYNAVDNNGTGGIITVTSISGGSAGYFVSIDDGSTWKKLGNGVTQTSFSSLSGNYYSIKTKDNKGCISETLETYSSWTKPSSALSISNGYPKWINPVCNSSNSTDNSKTKGSVKIKLSGGVTDYSVILQKKDGSTYTDISTKTANANQEIVFTELKVGKIYQLYIKNKDTTYGDLTTSEHTVSSVSQMNITGASQESPHCKGGEDGTITVSVENGTSPYTYKAFGDNSHDFSSTSNKIKVSAHNSYTVSVTDANSCTSSYSNTVKVVDPSALSITHNSGKSTKPYCTSATNGAIVLNIDGGNKPNSSSYSLVLTKQGDNSYSKTPNANNNKEYTFNSDIKAGTYYANLSYTYDGNKTCNSAQETITVDSQNPLSVTASQTQGAACSGKSDGEITLTMSGGMEPYNISYLNSTALIANGHSENSFIDTDLTQGESYSYTVSDTYGCTYTSSSITITNRTDPVNATNLEKIKDASCATSNDGELKVYMKDGVPKANNTYAIEIIDSNNNTVASGDYASESVFNVLPGTYNLNVTDAMGCTSTYSNAATVAGEDNSPINSLILSTHNITCSTGDLGKKDGKISLTYNLKEDADKYTFSLLKNNTAQGNTLANNTFSNLATGDYSVMIKHIETGCSLMKKASIGNNNNNPSPGITFGKRGCSNASNGTISLSPSVSYNSNANFEITFKDELNNDVSGIKTNTYFNASGLNKQNYKLTIKETSLGCTYTNNNITIPILDAADQVQVSISDESRASCETATDGLIEVTASGGNSGTGYLFSISGANSSFIENSLNNNKHQYSQLAWNSNIVVTVADDAGCTNSTSTHVIQAKTDDQRFKFSNSLSPTDETCPENNDGIISFSTTNGTNLNYSLTSDNGYNQTGTIGTSGSINQLDYGVYTLKLTDDNNCSIEDAVTIGSPTTPVFGFANSDLLVEDKAIPSGVIAANLTGGNSEFVYKLEHPDNTFTTEATSPEGDIAFTSLSGGIYKLWIRDINNCKYTNYDANGWYNKEFTINQPNEELQVSLANYKMVSCKSVGDASINIDATGGWDSQYQYRIKKPSNNSFGGWQASTEFNYLKPGTHLYQVKDYENVIREGSIAITEPDTLNIFVDKVINASCPNYADGKILLTTLNGIKHTDGLHYWAINKSNNDSIGIQTGNNDFTFNSVPKGNYNIFVQDAHNCVASKPFSVNQPDTAQIELSYNYVKEKGDATGFINALISEGNQDFYYQWYNQTTNQLIEQGRTNSLTDISNLTAGNYLLKVKDTAECIYEGNVWMERSIEIIEPDKKLAFEIDTLVDVSCNKLSDGWFRLAGIGGWGNDYRFGFSDIPEQMSVDSLFKDLTAGDYTLYIKDTANVIYSQIVNVPQPDTLQAELSNTRDANCFGEDNGHAWLDIQGGNSSYSASTDGITWQKGTELHNLTAGRHGVYVKDTLNCTIKIDSVDIFQPTDIVLTDTIIRISKCKQNSGRIDAFIEGGVPGYTYLWENENINSDDYKTNIADSIYAGAYNLTVTDLHNCSKNYDFYVSDLTDLSIDSISVNDVTCWGYNNGSAQMHVSKGTPEYSYTWDIELPQNNTNQISNLYSGTYTAGVSDTEGCIQFTNFYVGTPDSLGYSINSFINPLCYGGKKGSIDLTIEGGTPEYFINWSTGDKQSSVSNLDPGTYHLQLKDANDCENEFDFSFDYQRTIKPNLGNDTTICHYQTISINPGSYATYNWKSEAGFKSSKNAPTIIEPSTYSLIVTDNDNCLGYDTVTIQMNYFNIDDVTVKDVSCNGNADGEAKVTYSDEIGDVTFNWSGTTGTDLWTNLSGGDYNVSIKDAHGCEDNRDFSVYEPETVQIESFTITDPLCFGVPDGKINIDVTGGRGDYQYAWDTGSSSHQVAKLDSGYYHVSFWDKMNCANEETFRLNYQTGIFPDLGNDVTICNGNTYTMYPGKFETYKWSGLTTTEVTHDTTMITADPGIYYVETTDENSCVGRDTMEVFWRDVEINPVFLAASTIAVGDTLFMVEVSQPAPDEFDWIVSGDYEIVEEGPFHQNVVFNKPGVYEIGIDAFLTGCLAQDRKKIIVTEKGELAPNSEENEKSGFVVEFTASPNPATDYFTSKLELTEVSSAEFFLVDIHTGVTLERRKVSGTNLYKERFSVPESKSALILFVKVNNERHALKIVVIP